MNTSNFSILLTFTLILFSLNFPSQTTAESDLIKAVCSKTTNPTFCTTVLDSNPDSAQAGNPLALSEAVLTYAEANAEASVAFVLRHFSDAETEEHKEALRLCLENYSYSRRCFTRALREVSMEFEMANHDSEMAGTGFSFCETALAARKVEDAEVSERSKIGGYFSSMAYCATNLLFP